MGFEGEFWHQYTAARQVGVTANSLQLPRRLPMIRCLLLCMPLMTFEKAHQRLLLEKMLLRLLVCIAELTLNIWQLLS
jgi:hypothetical protein